MARFCMVLHGIAWNCMVLHDIAWYYMVLHGIAWYCSSRPAWLLELLTELIMMIIMIIMIMQLVVSALVGWTHVDAQGQRCETKADCTGKKTLGCSVQVSFCPTCPLLR